MIGVLADNLIVAFDGRGVQLLKNVAIEIAFMIIR
jgi:hypothetical protein